MERSSKARTSARPNSARPNSRRRVRGRVGWRGARPSPAAFAADGRACSRPPAAGGVSLRLPTKPMVVAIALVCGAAIGPMGNADQLWVAALVPFFVQPLVPFVLSSLVALLVWSTGATVPVGTARADIAMVPERSISGPVLAVRARSALSRHGVAVGLAAVGRAAVGLGSLGPPAPPLSLLAPADRASRSLPPTTSLSSRPTRSRRCRRPWSWPRRLPRRRWRSRPQSRRWPSRTPPHRRRRQRKARHSPRSSSSNRRRSSSISELPGYEGECVRKRLRRV